MGTPLRILHCMLGTGLGGIELAFARYAAGLTAQGAECIHCISEGAAVAAHLPQGAHTVTLPKAGQFDPFLLLAARALIRRVQPDIILAHGKRADRVFTYAQLTGKTVPHIEVLHRPRFHRLQRADCTITVSDDLKRGFLAAHGADACVETHPNFLLQLPPASAPRAIGQPPVIGFLGRFVPEKGLDLLLDAASLLQQRGYDFRLVIGGTGACEAECRAQAERLGLMPRIDWRGWVTDADGFYRSIDMLCVPSRRESFGLIVIEAFAYGKPVVATRTSGPGSIIEDNVTGMLCAIDAAALADALALLVQNPAHAQQLGMAAQAAAPRYTADAVMPAIMDCITRTVARFRS